MLRSLKSLSGYKILAVDGEIGKVDEFFLDDETWIIRYLVVNTGTWLTGRKVLISPVALGRPNWESKRFPVALIKEKVKNSPDIDVDKPVSRQHQIKLHMYYGWPPYWPTFWYYSIPPPLLIEREGEQTSAQQEEGDPHLRSTKEVMGYHIQAKDGDIGHVEDFVVDDENWIIRYMVVDTKNWLPGKRVLLPPAWIKEISWGGSKVYTDLTREAIKESPEYDPSAPVNREYEARFYDYYGRPKYWL